MGSHRALPAEAGTAQAQEAGKRVIRSGSSPSPASSRSDRGGRPGGARGARRDGAPPPLTHHPAGPGVAVERVTCVVRRVPVPSASIVSAESEPVAIVTAA